MSSDRNSKLPHHQMGHVGHYTTADDIERNASSQSEPRGMRLTSQSNPSQDEPETHGYEVRGHASNRRQSIVPHNVARHRDTGRSSPSPPTAPLPRADSIERPPARRRESITTNEQPKPSRLDTVARGFGNIGLKDFKKCILHLKDHPETLRANPEILKADARELFRSGDEQSATCRLQGFFILTRCQQQGLSDLQSAAEYIKALNDDWNIYTDMQRNIATLSATLRPATNATGQLGSNPQPHALAKEIPIRSRSYTEHTDGRMDYSASSPGAQSVELNMSRSLPGTTIQIAQSQSRGSQRSSTMEYHPRTSNNRLTMIEEQQLSPSRESIPNPSFVAGRDNPHHHHHAVRMTAPVAMKQPIHNIQPGPGVSYRSGPTQSTTGGLAPLSAGPIVSMGPFHTPREHQHGDNIQADYRDSTGHQNAVHSNPNPQPGYPRSNPAVEISPKDGDPSILGDRTQLEMKRSTTFGVQGYEVRKQDAHNFFSIGQVFKLWWCRPAGSDLDGNLNTDSRRIQVPGKPDMFMEEVWMLVVVRRTGYSLCCPISTYGDQGVLRKGLPRTEIRAHAVIYSLERGIDIDPAEARLLGKDPIPVKMDSGRSALRSKSRVHFGKFHTVEWNVPVRSIGKVPRDYQELIRHYFISDLLGNSQPRSAPTTALNAHSRNDDERQSQRRHGHRRR